MPTFGTPFAGNKSGLISKEEVIRAVRFSISAEFEATQQYMQIAEATDDERVKAVMFSIANEERVHAGEFMRLLHELDPEEKIFYAKGAREVEELINERNNPQ